MILAMFANTTIYYDIYGIVAVLLALFVLIGSWKIFEKAGEAGWKVLIPFYNTYTLFRIAGRNGWGFLLLIIPIVNIIAAIMVLVGLAERFRKGPLFAILWLILFPFVGTLALGYGSATYTGQKHQ